MPVASFLVPYITDTHMGGRTRRTLPFDAASEDIEAADGFWSEAEVAGDRAIVRCRAPLTVLANLNTTFQQVQGLATVWTPNRDGGKPSKTLTELGEEVLTDPQLSVLKSQVEKLVARCDREGYVRLDDMPWKHASRVLAMAARRGYGLDRLSTGTFPTTSVLDDFNRASIGSNWTDYSGGGALQISSSTLLSGSAGDSEGYWNVAAYGPDAEVYCDISTKPPTNTSFALELVQPNGTPAPDDGYFILLITVSGAANDTLQKFRKDNNSDTQLGATITQEMTNGESYGMERLSGVVTPYRKSGGTWSAMTGTSEATYALTTYRVGVYIENTTTRLDNVGGGNVVVAATFMPRVIGPF